MTNSILIHNPNCSKSRGAKDILEEKGISFSIIDYLKGELTEELLSELPRVLKLEFQDFIRKNEEIYKELNLAEKNLSNTEWIKIIQEHPLLLERPIFIHNGKGIIGRPPGKILDII